MSINSLDRVYVASLALQREAKGLRAFISRNAAELSRDGQNPELWIRLFDQSNEAYESALNAHTDSLVAELDKTQSFTPEEIARCQPAPITAPIRRGNRTATVGIATPTRS